MISSEHPFVPEEGDREPVRRFRGRHAAGVSILTSGEGRAAAGLTVSSLIVLEGEPGYLAAAVGPMSDFWDSVERTGRFVVHMCESPHRPLSDLFAGIRPSPGGLFAAVDWSPSVWGAVLDDIPDRAFCRVDRLEPLGYTGLLVGAIEDVELANLTDPLVHFRGEYRSLR